MTLKRNLIVALPLILGLIAAFAMAEEAAKDGGFKLGVLSCTSDPSTQKNLGVHSSVQVACEFKREDGSVDKYVGESGIGLGLDLNWKREDELKYAVMAAVQDKTPGTGDLAGKFLGGKGNVSLGVGGGVGVLVGGSDKNITLQPLAVEKSKGWSLAGGVSYLTLKAAPAE